jgi:SAM-dependent methyltransferase
MIDLARRLNRYPDRVEYVCTAGTGLAPLPSGSFHCIYSNIVLQHVPPDVAVDYLHEFFRLLGPDGLLVFQLPSHRESRVAAEITAMPDAAYVAGITLAVPPPERVTAGSAIAITLMVRNTSQHTWRQPDVGPLAVGNHWLDAAGELMLLQDDGRSPLLQDVPPGLEWPVLLTMRAPGEPGSYVCEIDLVHEGVTWFGHKGSRTVRVTIDVTRDSVAAGTRGTALMKEYPVPEYPDGVVPAPSGGSEPLPEMDFPVDGVPREQVMAIIHQHGARLAYLEEDRRAGPEWVSYRYFVAGRP